MSIGRLLPASLLAYMVLLGGTSAGELHPLVRIATSLIVAGLVVAWLRGGAHQPDRLDLAVLASLLLFLGACLLSQFMRQSFDAGWMAIGLAAALVIGRRVVWDTGTRALLLAAMAALSLCIAGITVLLWLPTTVAWVMASGGLAPPLDLVYPSAPWGHPHDLALLLVMLAPAWLDGMRRHRLWQVLAVFAWAATGVIVVLDGSRNLWLAIAVASVLAGWSRFGLRRWLTRRMVIGLAVVAVGGGVVISLTLLDRVLNFATIGARYQLWEAAIHAWIAAPLAGHGPGSFPFLLQTTGYFDTNAWAPRHPDSAVFQLLPEAGLIGLAAAALLVIAIVPRLGKSRPSSWALTTFLVACLAANPTDFGFLVAIAIAWLACATSIPPMREADQGQRGRTRVNLARPLQVASMCLVAVAILAHASALAAELASWRAGEALSRGDIGAAERDISTAMALDPSLALYHRIDGLIDWADGGPTAAVPALTAAVRINPSDDLAWRQLAAAQWQSHAEEAAVSSIRTALRLQRSDIANMLLAVRIESAAGHADVAHSLLAEAVLGRPTVAVPASWALFMADVGAEEEDVLAMAIERWRDGQSSPWPLRTQPIWLVALGDRPDLRTDAVDDAPESRSLAQAMSAALACDSPSAQDALAEASSSKVYDPLYWQVRIALASLNGAEDPNARTALDAMIGPVEAAPDDIDVLEEGTAPGFSIDKWGYGRVPILVPGLAGSVPRPMADWTAGCSR